MGKKSYWQKWGQALRTTQAAGKSWITCPEGENKYMAKKAHKLESSLRAERAKHCIASKLKRFQIALILRNI